MRMTLLDLKDWRGPWLAESYDAWAQTVIGGLSGSRQSKPRDCCHKGGGLRTAAKQAGLNGRVNHDFSPFDGLAKAPSIRRTLTRLSTPTLRRAQWG